MSNNSAFWLANPSTEFYNGVATQSLRMNFGDHIANDFQLAFDAYGASYFHSNALFRDETNWYNIVWVWDTPNGTQNKRQRAFVNGVEVTSMASGTRSGIRQMLAFGGNHQHTIFANYYNGSYDSYASGHHSYNCYINGHALDPTAFGQDKNGVWIPKDYETKPSLIAQDTGTAIGDLTAQGGLAGAFNGTRFQATSSGAATSGNVSTAYIGKNWGSSKTITGFILYSPTSDGFVGSGGSTFTVKLYGKNGAPSSGTDGTLLFTSSSVNDNLVSTNGERGSIRYFVDTTIVSEETISSFTTTAFTYHWVLITPNSSTTVNVGQIEFYEDGNNYFGTGGFRLDFNASDLNTTGGSRTDPYGSGTDQPNNTIADASGSGNHLSYSGVVATDFSSDSPENNFCVLNTVGKQSSSALSEGNLKAVITSGGNSGRTPSTFAVNSGKWYWEVRQSSSNRFAMGVFDADNYVMTNEDGGVDQYEWVHVTSDNSGAGQLVNNSNYTNSYGGTAADGHVIMVALDVDNGAIWFGKQGTWYNKGTSDNSATVKAQIEAGTTTNAAFTSVTGRLTPCFVRQTSNNTINVNFGQDDTFAGTETTAGNTDSNNNGKFQYEPPSGFLALCSDNLPDVTIGPDSDTQATDHHTSVLYTANSQTAQTITGVGMQADWLWFKQRSRADSHALFDTSRGIDKDFRITTDGEFDDSNSETLVTAVGADGFTLGTDAQAWVNYQSDTMVTWLWKANGGTLTTNDASATSVGTIDSQYQANTKAGFSIVLYNGTGANGTIAHGLSSAPEMVIYKSRDSTQNWVVYHKDIGNAHTLYLDLNNAKDSTTGTYNSTDPTSTVLSVGDANYANKSGDKFVAYAFHGVEGFSKFGSFVGNNLLDGPFVHLGFKPSWLMAKRADSTSDWFILDNKRSPENVVGGGGVGQLAANQNYAESSLSSYAIVDFLSNGFKMRSDMNYGYWNADGGTYIYMAFAEQPFKFSNAR